MKAGRAGGPPRKARPPKGTRAGLPAGWGRSSVGRALEWHSRGQGFDSPRLHQIPPARLPLGCRVAPFRPECAPRPGAAPSGPHQDRGPPATPCRIRTVTEINFICNYRRSRTTGPCLSTMNRLRIARARSGFRADLGGRDAHFDGVPYHGVSPPQGAGSRRPYALCLPLDLARPRRLRGLDPVRSVPQAHAGAGSQRDLYLGHPQFEGFEAVLDR